MILIIRVSGDDICFWFNFRYFNQVVIVWNLELGHLIITIFFNEFSYLPRLPVKGSIVTHVDWSLTLIVILTATIDKFDDLLILNFPLFCYLSLIVINLFINWILRIFIRRLIVQRKFIFIFLLLIFLRFSFAMEEFIVVCNSDDKENPN